MDMTEYVILPGADYGAACDAVRQKTGKTEGIKSGELAAEILAIAPKLQEKAVSPGTQAQNVVADEGYDGLSEVAVAAIKLQEKTAVPTTEVQEVLPDEGYDGLEKVTVEAASVSEAILQEKTVSPSTSVQTVEPDEGYDGLSSVTVGAMKLTTKSITPTTSSQTIEPSGGYDGFSRVYVGAISLDDDVTVSVTKTGSMTVRVYYNSTNVTLSTTTKTFTVRKSQPITIAIEGSVASTASPTSSISTGAYYATPISRTYTDGSYKKHLKVFYVVPRSDSSTCTIKVTTTS